MSSYMVLKSVSEALRDILWQAFVQEQGFNQIVASREEIVFHNPTETARNTANKLSLWLYQVSENEFLKGQPPERTGVTRVNDIDGDRGRRDRFPPLALNLSYLVTPFASRGEEAADTRDLLLLGKTMQVMYDNAIVPLRDADDVVDEELTIVLSRMPLEELTRVWEALREPYRLSVCYQVRVTRVDSLRTQDQGRIVDRRARFDAPRAPRSDA